MSFGQAFSENQHSFRRLRITVVTEKIHDGKFMDSQFIITVRFGHMKSFPISNDQRKIPNRVFVAVLEHDENCALLYGVFIFG